jgi:hypothetical protein
MFSFNFSSPALVRKKKKKNNNNNNTKKCLISMVTMITTPVVTMIAIPNSRILISNDNLNVKLKKQLQL